MYSFTYRTLTQRLQNAITKRAVEYILPSSTSSKGFPVSQTNYNPLRLPVWETEYFKDVVNAVDEGRLWSNSATQETDIKMDIKDNFIDRLNRIELYGAFNISPTISDGNIAVEL